MTLARFLLVLSTVVFAVTGLLYVAVPGIALSIAGIAGDVSNEFLLRTEGVALLAGGGFLWAARDSPPRQVRLVLGVLAAYYIVGSSVDLAARADGIVADTSIVSALARIALGIVCLAAAARI